MVLLWARCEDYGMVPPNFRIRESPSCLLVGSRLHDLYDLSCRLRRRPASSIPFPDAITSMLPLHRPCDIPPPTVGHQRELLYGAAAQNPSGASPGFKVAWMYTMSPSLRR